MRLVPEQGWTTDEAEIRRLASRMLRDPALVDETVQESWIALEASRARGVEPANPDAYHRTVVRNVGLAQQRRQHPAGRVDADLDVQPDSSLLPDEAAELSETTARVRAAVSKLKPAHRRAVELVLLEGHSVVEAGQILGMPHDTVRTNLSRASRALVGRLDKEFGDRRRMNAALASLAGLTPAELATARGPAVVIPPASPAPPLLALAAALLAMAGLAWIAVRATGKPSAVVTAVDRGYGDLQASETREAAPASAATAAATRSSVSSGEWTVSGAVHWGPSFGPSPGAGACTVLVELLSGPSPDASVLCATETTTDASGTFRAALPAPADVAPDHIVLVRARAVVERCMSRSDDAAVGPLDDPPAGLDVRLFPLDRAVGVCVRDQDGAAVAGASVRLGDELLETGPDGTCRTWTSSLLPQEILLVWAPGYAVSRTPIEWTDDVIGAGQIGAWTADGTAGVLNVLLRPELAVEGIVRDEAGQPLEGVRVAESRALWLGAVTDPTGAFHLGHLDPTSAYQLLVCEKAGYAHHQAIERSQTPTAPWEFVLKRGVDVEGVVLARRGGPTGALEPVAAAQVRALAQGRTMAVATAISDPTGAFSLRGLAPGNVRLQAARPGFAPTVSELLDLSGSPSELRSDIELGPGAAVEGRVLDEAGTGVPGAAVTVRHRDVDLGIDARSDANGSFRLERLPLGPVVLAFRASDRRGAAELDLAGDVEDLVVTLARAGARLSGRVLDAATRVPLPGASIRLVGTGADHGEPIAGDVGARWLAREGVAIPAADGRWSGTDLRIAPGQTIAVLASAPGYASGIEIVAVGDGDEDMVVEHALVPGGTLTGVVVEAATGAPLGGAWIEVLWSPDGGGRPAPVWSVSIAEARADSDGRFAFERVPDGVLHLAVECDGWPPHVDGPHRVDGFGGADTDRRVEIGRGATAEARAFDLGGNARAFAEFRVRGRRGEAARRVDRRGQADDHGVVVFPSLPPGGYEVTILEPLDGASGIRIPVLGAEVLIEERGGTSTAVDLVPRGTASLTVEIESALELPESLPIAVERIGGSAGDVNRRGGVARGRFLAIEGLEAGEYRVSLAHEYLPVPGSLRAACLVHLASGGAGTARLQVVGAR